MYKIDRRGAWGGSKNCSLGRTPMTVWIENFIEIQYFVNFQTTMDTRSSLNDLVGELNGLDESLQQKRKVCIFWKFFGGEGGMMTPLLENQGDVYSRKN